MSERIGVLERAEISHEINPVRQIFGDLPVDSSFNPEWLSPLIDENKSKDELKEIVNNRYLDILNIRRKYGVEGSYAVTNDIGVALLSDQLFEQILLENQQEGQTHETARHEIGHRLVAEGLGWSASSTVIPRGNYLGLTQAVPKANLTLEDWLLESAAINYGGKIAAEISGDLVHGAGSDMASIEAKAKIAAYHPASRFQSESEFMSAARRLAKSMLNRSVISASAKDLAHKKVA